MSVTTGNSEKWGLAFESMHQLVLSNLERVWPLCVKHFNGAYTHEQRVTNKLVVELRKVRKGINRIPARIAPQYALLQESSATGTVTTKGYIDFAVLVGDDDEVYLAYECKWLNVPTKRGARAAKAREYVRDGLQRYVTEQYAASLPRAYMVGYVYDSDLIFARRRVYAQIVIRQPELGCESLHWTQVGHGLPAMERWESRHARPTGDVLVEHIFLPFRP